MQWLWEVLRSLLCACLLTDTRFCPDSVQCAGLIIWPADPTQSFFASPLPGISYHTDIRGCYTLRLLWELSISEVSLVAFSLLIFFYNFCFFGSCFTNVILVYASVTNVLCPLFSKALPSCAGSTLTTSDNSTLCQYNMCYSCHEKTHCK